MPTKHQSIMTPDQRNELQDLYVNQIINDNMDPKSIIQLAFDLLHNYLDKQSDKELIDTVKELYPELLNAN